MYYVCYPISNQLLIVPNSSHISVQVKQEFHEKPIKKEQQDEITPGTSLNNRLSSLRL